MKVVDEAEVSEGESNDMNCGSNGMMERERRKG